MFRPVSETEVRDRTVLVRADLNVPLVEGQIGNAVRLQRLVPGLRTLLDRGAKVVLLSHFGRPKGQMVPRLSLEPVANALGMLLERPLRFVDDIRGVKAKEAAGALQPGEALVLENLRFDPGEEANDPTLAKDLAEMGDLYVNDAFSAAHRAHASTEALAQLLPAYAGDLMAAELGALDLALSLPDRPVLAIVAGAKVSTKFRLLFNLVAKVDFLVIGGGMANTFLHAQGQAVGTSLNEPELAGRALEVLDRAHGLGCEVILPIDAVFAPNVDQGQAAQTGAIRALPKNVMILDFGPKSVEAILTVLPKVKTLIWNGPLGAFEFPPFGAATLAVAEAAAAQTRAGQLQSVAGGGDTVAALAQANVLDDLSYVSTAGGAFLEWIEGRQLPGVTALSQI